MHTYFEHQSNQPSDDVVILMTLNLQMRKIEAQNLWADVLKVSWVLNTCE